MDITNGLKLDWLEKLDEGLPKSDLVIVLDVPQKESFARKKQNRDKFEKNKEFSNKISQNYRKLAKKKRWRGSKCISKSKDKVHQDVMKIVAKKMGL